MKPDDAERLWWYAARVLRVIDGDTLVVDLDLGLGITARQTVRLLGVNTPELRGDDAAAGAAAKVFVASLTLGLDVLVRTHKDRDDKYGRLLAEIWAHGKSLAEELRLAGFTA